MNSIGARWKIETEKKKSSESHRLVSLEETAMNNQRDPVSNQVEDKHGDPILSCEHHMHKSQLHTYLTQRYMPYTKN